MTIVLAIDPGTTQSGFCVLDHANVMSSGVFSNAKMLSVVQRHASYSGVNAFIGSEILGMGPGRAIYAADVLAIEMIASYGMAVGKEIFETVRWIGRFQQAWRDPEAVQLVYRQDVKLHLCGSSRAKDQNVRQALIDLYPASGGGKTPQIGTQRQPGPLYGVSTHAWPALGVAVLVQARMQSIVRGTTVRWTTPIEQMAEQREPQRNLADVPF